MKTNSERNKKWIEDHPDYFKNYYKNNREKYVRTLKHCDVCNCNVKQISIHLKTYKHQRNLDNKN